MKQFLNKQNALLRLLSNVYDGTVGQAYIFEGMKGIGKYTASLIFAAAIHCTGEKKPCWECPDCKKHMAGTHPDLYIMGDNANIKVDDIREMASELYIRPAVAKKKICIIKNADTMNDKAQNALLKSFEEPPPYGVIILLSENAQNLLMTVRSRGTKVVFEPFAEKDIEEFIKSAYPQNAHQAEFVAKYSGGIIGKAIEICENEEFFKLRSDMFDAVFTLTGSRLSIFQVADLFGIKKPKGAVNECGVYFDLFLSFMRDVAALKTGAQIINEDKRGLIEAFSSKVTLTAATEIITKAAQTRMQLNVSMKYDLWIINMLISCWEDIHGKSSRS